MDSFARAAADVRESIFSRSASARKTQPLVIEKDFWICWTLRRLFSLGSVCPERLDAKDGPLQPSSVLKGGTSLSKAFGTIERFSEDIDLFLAPKLVGMEDSASPDLDGLGKKTVQRRVRALDATARAYVTSAILPELYGAVREQLGERDAGEWALEHDGKERQTLQFSYPRALPQDQYSAMIEGDAYIGSSVKIEFGSRSGATPCEIGTIQSYAAEDVPRGFSDPEVKVRVQSLTRTFWEKATALHSMAQRPERKGTPPAFSRHYFDFAELLSSEARKAAVDAKRGLPVLVDVARSKSIHYPENGVSYENVANGGLQLVPDVRRIEDLARDFEEMESMLFSPDPPGFAVILEKIGAFEMEFNEARQEQ